MRKKLTRPYVHLIFGARQTGKSTLLRALLPPETLVEHPADQRPISYAVSPLPFAWKEGQKQKRPFPASDLLTRLSFGELPGVAAAREADRAELLRAFAFVHLEEEIRREALVKDWGAFVRFIQLASR